MKEGDAPRYASVMPDVGGNCESNEDSSSSEDESASEDQQDNTQGSDDVEVTLHQSPEIFAVTMIIIAYIVPQSSKHRSSSQ